MPRVGCGRADITPEPGLPMVGMPGSPRGEGVQWPLRSRVFLVDDGERWIVVVCLDLMALVSNHVAELRQRLAVPGEIDPENILVACSHTHRAFAMRSFVRAHREAGVPIDRIIVMASFGCNFSGDIAPTQVVAAVADEHVLHGHPVDPAAQRVVDDRLAGGVDPLLVRVPLGRRQVLAAADADAAVPESHDHRHPPGRGAGGVQRGAA